MVKKSNCIPSAWKALPVLNLLFQKRKFIFSIVTMKTNLSFSLFIIFLFAFFFSCQKEINWDIDKQSRGNIAKDINGNCLPAMVGGVYMAGQSAGDSNFIQVGVNVTSAGTYAITTDSINGYYFKATGNFNNTGYVQVTLVCFGKPNTASTDHFSIRYDSSVCVVTIPVQSVGIDPALFTLQGGPGFCMNDTLLGSYVKDYLLDSSAKVKVSVNVTTPGTYKIATDNVNSYSFSGTGVFIVTGVQTVELTASGTPVNTGTDLFTVVAGNSKCNFSVNVLTAVAVTRSEYFPLAINNYWTYDDLLNPGDTIRRTITNTIQANVNTYQIMQEEIKFQSPVQYLFRKTGSDYYEYAHVDKYTGSFSYGNPEIKDLLFFKENNPAPSSWTSPEFTDTASFGQVLILKYNYFCTEANAAVTINGKAFINVYKITMLPQIRALNEAFGYTGEVYTWYYAKGIGLIYFKKTANGFFRNEMQIRNWQVN